MDQVNVLLTKIIDKIQVSNLSDSEKANLYAEIGLGLDKLVWPIIMSHLPKEKLEQFESKKQMSTDEYTELIESALNSPGMPKEVHDEVLAALQEVDSLINL